MKGKGTDEPNYLTFFPLAVTRCLDESILREAGAVRDGREVKAAVA